MFDFPEDENTAPVFAGDPEATWQYWGADERQTVIPKEWVWERLRNRRNALIAECDWRMVSDAPWDITPWVEYRQALRDLTETTEDPRLAVWPEKP